MGICKKLIRLNILYIFVNENKYVNQYFHFQHSINTYNLHPFSESSNKSSQNGSERFDEEAKLRDKNLADVWGRGHDHHRALLHGRLSNHVHLHHEVTVIMRRMMAPQRVHEGTVTHEPILVQVTAEVHKLIDEVHAGRRAHHQHSDV